MKVVTGLVAAVLALGCMEGGRGAPATPAPGASGSKVYVANEDDGTLSVIAVESNTVAGTIDFKVEVDGKGWMYMLHNVQAAPDGKSIWATGLPMAGSKGASSSDMSPAPTAAAAAEDQVFVVDPSMDMIVARIPIGTGMHPAHVVLDPESSTAYVTANEANEVLAIDAKTYAVTKHFPLGKDHGPHGMRWCAGQLWIANMTAKSVTMLDPKSGMVMDMDVGGVAVQTACMPDGKSVFASLYDTKEVVRLPVSGGALTRIALPDGAQGPIQLYPSSDGHHLYVCDQGNLEGRPPSNKLYVIDVEEATVTATIEVGQAAHGVVVSDDGDRIYVTNTLDDTVSVIDAADQEVVATVKVGGAPNGVAHWHVTGGMP